jgi:transcriptional regulator with XRE-family HTH domain
MSFPQNLRFFRKRKGLTQTALAEALGITRAAVGSYEEGRAEPRLDLLKKFCDFLEVDPRHMIAPNRILEEADYASGSKIRLLTIPKGADSGNALLVPHKAAAGYLDGFDDPRFMSELPHVHLPMRQFKGLGTLRVFEIEGESMLPIPSGAFVIGAYVQDWRKLNGRQACLVISRTEGLVFKKVKFSGNKISLSSLNPSFSSFDRDVEDILEIWKAVGYISLQLPDTFVGEI